MSRFFIDRPVFAWVIAILLMVGGAVSIKSLPVAQYPSIAPPTIAITATYPGASAKVLEDTVTQVIEQKLNGIDHLRYIQSASLSSGQVTITVTFEVGTDPDIAQVQVQNKVAQAAALLPAEVQLQGLIVDKAVQNFLLVIGFVSEDGSLSGADLCDFAVGTIQDPISRLPGVGDILAFGTQYAMRIWLDPGKLYQYQFTTSDVTAAIAAQNVQISAGQLGANPAVRGQLLNASIMAQSLLKTPAEFRKIVLRVNPDGSRVLLGDVARVELGSENYDTDARFCGKPAAGMAIKPATGANALDTVAVVKKKIAEMSPGFPPGIQVVYPYDTTPFVRLSIEEVIKTLVEAVVLVFLVMFLFLQSWRATIIPTIAVPVVLLGTFGAMSVAGFSINTLTLFGLVLAIGLLVDDAIVVVENVERVMEEEGLSPKEATRKSMDQISGAGRHRPGSLCGLFAHGLFCRCDGSDLPAICRHHGRGGGALGAGGLDPHAGPLCHLAQAGAPGRTRPAARLFWLVQPQLRSYGRALCVQRGHGAAADLLAAGGLWLHRGRRGVSVYAHSFGLLA